MIPTLNQILAVFSLLAFAATGVRVTQLSRFTRDTTAETARRWGLVACVSGMLPGLLELCAEGSNEGSTYAQYFSAVMLLTPLIAMLGARNPGAAAWPWFVILPLIIVLQWPAASQLASAGMSTALVVPTPTILGYLFVLVMGAGNYFGTANTLQTMVAASGAVCLLLPVTEWTGDGNGGFLAIGSVLIAVSVATIRLPTVETDSNNPQHSVQALWSLFRDMYGLVWAKRVMDRVNQMIARESIGAVLTLDGFESTASGVRQHIDEPRTESELVLPSRAIEIFCWVLRRFFKEQYLQRIFPDAPMEPGDSD